MDYCNLTMEDVDAIYEIVVRGDPLPPHVPGPRPDQTINQEDGDDAGTGLGDDDGGGGSGGASPEQEGGSQGLDDAAAQAIGSGVLERRFEELNLLDEATGGDEGFEFVSLVEEMSIGGGGGDGDKTEAVSLGVDGAGEEVALGGNNNLAGSINLSTKNEAQLERNSMGMDGKPPKEKDNKDEDSENWVFVASD